MFKLLFALFQFIILLIIATWAIQNSKPVSFVFNDIIVTTSTSILILGMLIVIIVVILSQKFIYFLKQSSQKYQFYRKNLIYKKGHNSFLQGMVALANKDFKRAAIETKNVNKYLKDETLGLLLKSETLKIEKKFNELNKVYELMIKNPDTNLLGLRGLMEQNIRAQDFHHAFVYGEKLFNLNPHIDKLYETLVSIIVKINNWQKLLQITDHSMKYKIIDKKIFIKNTSIALYEIAKIKHQNSESESIALMGKALKLNEHFPPFICFYVQLFININNLQKAKKVLTKAWTATSHPDLKKQIKLLAKIMKVSLCDLVKYITSKTSNHPESIILMTEAFIEEKRWEDAKNQVKLLLTHQPTRDVCLLMAKIEEGDSGDPQKINSWVSRSNFGQLSKIWICQISGVSQAQWSSISKAGHFNTLVWEQPKNINKLYSPVFESELNQYIEN